MRAELAAERCDLLLAVGSTLQVYPVAGVVPVAKRAGARLVIVNAEETAFDDLADVLVRAPIGDVLPTICGDRRPSPAEPLTGRPLRDP